MLGHFEFVALECLRRFVRVEPPRTQVKLHQRPGSLSCAMVRIGWEEVNNPELMRNYPVIIVPSRAQWFDQWFEEVR